MVIGKNRPSTATEIHTMITLPCLKLTKSVNLLRINSINNAIFQLLAHAGHLLACVIIAALELVYKLFPVYMQSGSVVYMYV